MNGTCHVFFAFEAGFAIDLAKAQQLLASDHCDALALGPRNLGRSEFQPQPVRVVEPMQPLSVAGHRTAAESRVTIFDFGALSVAFRIPVDGSVESLLPLGRALLNNAEFIQAAKQVAQRVLERIGPAVAKPHLVGQTEDYVVYALQGGAVPSSPDQMDRTLIARLLRAEEGPLSQQETADAFAHTVQYGPNDLAIIDWNAALLMDDDPASAIAVLEYANTELLEMRHLDNELDRGLSEAYELSARHLRRRQPWGGRLRHDASRLAEFQIDAATLFEAVNNALKLFGDQYLARLHAAAVLRFHTEDYERSVLRKIETLESIYEKMKDNQTQVRMEILEWIIIALIALEIVLSLWRH